MHPTFPLRFVSYASVYANPAQASINPDMVVDLVGSCVGKHSPDDEMHYPTTRALLLSSRPLAPHETFNHPVGVLFAISTTTPDPMTTLQRLYGQAVGTGAQAAPWMDGVQVLKFFVVVHDVSKAGADLEGANELLALVKKAYGPHSTLLVINSRTPSDSQPPTAESAPVTSMIPRKPEITDHASIVKAYAAAMSNLTLSPMAAAAESGGQAPRSYAQRLSSEDVDRLIAVVRELVVQSLVPWMEARVREWNEAYQSNRRGLTGRLFGAGRKLFGTSRPSSPSPAAGHAVYNPAKGFYPVNSVEALARRLADFSFMLRDYRYSASIYDNLRRDYTQDRAWRYVSAATEMHGLATLLSNGYFHPGVQPGNPTPQTTLQHSDICASLEQAVTTYLGRTGGVGAVHLDALRVTVLYYEAWKALNEWRGVGALLVRAAGEADEVPCAVIVEEAAAADVKGGKSQRGRRRQAFHLVMAARRYEKAGLVSNPIHTFVVADENRNNTQGDVSRAPPTSCAMLPGPPHVNVSSTRSAGRHTRSARVPLPWNTSWVCSSATSRRRSAHRAWFSRTWLWRTSSWSHIQNSWLPPRTDSVSPRPCLTLPKRALCCRLNPARAHWEMLKSGRPLTLKLLHTGTARARNP